MSGVAILYDRTGGGDLGHFDRLFETLDYRGHDGRDIFEDGRCAIGHQHCWETSAEVGERQPTTVGEIHVSLSGRLDNRDALTSALPASTRLADVTDAELVGHAYREWGLTCLERALGSFSVAIWDPDRQRIVCAVDKTGSRHLFFGVTADSVVAGSDIDVVLSHPAFGGEPNERALAAYLSMAPGTPRATFYEDVYRLEPGSLLLVEDDAVSVDRYWDPTAGLNLRGANRAKLRSRLRTTLRAATEARMRSRGRPALLMSGGLDSTTLAGITATDDEPAAIDPFSVVYEDVDDERLVVDERQRIRDTAEMHDLEFDEIVSDDASPLSYPELNEELLRGGPVLDPLGGAMEGLFERIGDTGHRVAMTGHGGNALDGSRMAYADLFRRGNLLTLVRMLREDPMPTRWLVKWYVLAVSVPRISHRFIAESEPPHWHGPKLRTLETDRPSTREELFSIYRRRTWNGSTGVSRTHKLHNARRQALRHGVSLQMPYFDARIMELAYSIPPHELLDAGQRNGLFREAFGDILPESVRSIEKGRFFNAPLERALRQDYDRFAEVFSDSVLEATGYVRPGASMEQLDALLDGEGNAVTVWRLYTSERWLSTIGSL